MHVLNFYTRRRQIAAQSERLSWDQTPRETRGRPEQRSHQTWREPRVSEIPDSHTEPCLFVRFSIFILCSPSQQHPFLFSPRPKAAISHPSSSLTLSQANSGFFLLFFFPPPVSPCCFLLLCVSDTRTDCVS